VTGSNFIGSRESRVAARGIWRVVDGRLTKDAR